MICNKCGRNFIHIPANTVVQLDGNNRVVEIVQCAACWREEAIFNSNGDNS